MIRQGNKKEKNRIYVMTECALLSALGLAFSWLELLIPLPAGIPGIKLGLANIVVVVALFRRGAGAAFIVNIVRILLAGLLFGTGFSTLYALCGGLSSFLIMLALSRCKAFSVTGISMAGGVFHNLAQIAVAAMITRTAGIFAYFPVLMFTGMLTGIINGILAVAVLRRLPG